MSGSPATGEAPPGSAPTGTLYDLGYRHYEGERLGRAWAVRSLFQHGLAAVFAVGRGPRARAVPLLLGALVVLPAVIQSAVAAYTGGMLELILYENYFSNMAVIFALFCAAQAPELVSADLRSRSIVLYLARALRKDDYLLARVGSLAAAVFALGLAPQLVLFSGRVLQAAEPWGALRDELSAVPAILVSCAAVALLMATVSIAIASFTERRGIAAALVIGYFLLSAAFAGTLFDISDGGYGWVLLLDPFTVLNGFAHWLFDAEAPAVAPIARADLPGWAYGAACLGFVALWAGVLRLRFRSIGR